VSGNSASPPRRPFISVWVLIAAATAAVSAWGAARGSNGWTTPVIAIGAAIFLFFLPRFLPRSTETVLIDEVGIRRVAGRIKERVEWDQVKSVRIVTSGDGPFVEDVYFLIDAKDGKGCCISHEAATRANLLQALDLRLKNIDSEEVIRAMGSTGNATFVIWSRA
jgi:hypothetical protein